MGNCAKGQRNGEKLPKVKMNEHSNVRRKITAGVNLEKDMNGEINFGFRAGLEIKKDKEYSLVGLEKEEPHYATITPRRQSV